MKAVPGRVVAINKTSHDIEGAVRITKDTNLMQLISGNDVIIHTDDKTIMEVMMFKLGMIRAVCAPKSVIIRGDDWSFQMRMEDIS